MNTPVARTGHRGPRPPDGGSGVPLWQQVEADLRRRIATGEFSVTFPGEHDLTEQYGVSRHTIRESLRRLRAEETVVSARGRGTAVRPAAIDQPLGTMYSLFRSVEAAGLEQRSQVRVLDVRQDDEVSDRLGYPAATEYVFLERLRLAQGEPLALDRAWLLRELADPLLAGDFGHSGLYDELARLTGKQLTGGREFIRAEVPDRQVRRLLDLPADAATLSVERIGALGEQPVELRRSIIRGDRFAMTTEWPGTDSCRIDVTGTRQPVGPT
jgi:GntR family transcriptional regulator